MKSLHLLLFLLPALSYSQIIDFAVPRRFPNKINTDGEEIGPILSTDRQVLYFTRALSQENVGGITAGSDIWSATLGPLGTWGTPTNQMPTWNNRKNNAVIGVGAEDKIVYLLNSYKESKSGIAFSKIIDGEWSKPEIIPINGIENKNFVGFYMNPTFDVLFISMSRKDSYGMEDIYVSVRDSLDHWSDPMNVGPSINTKGFELSPFLTKDKKRLYFSSSGHGGFGDADIFVSERLYDSWQTWSVPRNLGSNINSPKFDAYFTLIEDSIAFFASNRAGKSSEIYSVEAKKYSDEIPAGRKLIPANELETIFGGAPQRLYEFDMSSTGLSDYRRELLLFTINQIVNRQDILVHVIAYSGRTVESQLVAERRIITLIDEFRIAGLPRERISFSVREKGLTDNVDNLVEIAFYR